MKSICLYDTTLRDGSQSEDVTFTVEDKIRISHKLDELGMHYIEGGWPGSNPKDIDYFEKVKNESFRQAKIVAFGSTRYPGNKAEDDPNLQQLVKAETQAVTIFGKSWDLHVREALSTNQDENLRMIFESLEFLKKHCSEVLFDAEHFFDGYKCNPEYALKVVKEAESAGADWIVLCDTNGGSLPSEITSIFTTVKSEVRVKLGIHTHNDSELAVANALAAIDAGGEQVQGTVNGIGERCWNTNLISIIPNLKIKMGLGCISNEQMQQLKDVSSFVDELANKAHWNHQPFVGQSAFAHKGGVHVSAIQKNPKTYEHIEPEIVGNHRRILVSDLSGKSNISYKAQELGISLGGNGYDNKRIVSEVKRMEDQGYQFDAAEGSLELLMKKVTGQFQDPFTLESFRVNIEKNRSDPSTCQVTIKISVGEEEEITAAEGIGPVNALDNALRKALTKFFPQIQEMGLVDFKVRVIDGSDGTSAKVRVQIDSRDANEIWSTIGVSENIIEASWQALMDSVHYKLSK